MRGTDRGPYRRCAARLHHPRRRPRRIARWCHDDMQGRMRLLQGQASLSKTRQGQQWRLFWRIKRIGRT